MSDRDSEDWKTHASLFTRHGRAGDGEHKRKGDEEDLLELHGAETNS